LAAFQNVGKYVFSVDYISYLVLSRFGAFVSPTMLEPEFLQSLADPEVGVDQILELPPELAVQVIADLQRDREARLLVDRIKSGEPEDKEVSRQELLDKALKIVAETQARTQEQWQAEIERVEKDIADLRSQLAEAHAVSEQGSGRVQELATELGRTKEELEHFRHMSWWDRVRFVFRDS
jgi:hypothetical protein